MKRSRGHQLLRNARVLRRIAQAPAILLAVDLDGTLAPLRQTPGAVRVTQPVRAILRACHRLPQCWVAIISGRAVEDVRRRVGVPSLIYAGNHGLEIVSPWGRHLHPAARRVQPTLRAIRTQLKRALRGMTGALVEDKRSTLSIHYRRVHPRQRMRVLQVTRRVLQPWMAIPRVMLTRGTMVLEIRPAVAWGKGHAVRWVLARCRTRGRRVLPIILGDDRTDEDAFRMFRGRAVTIRVGQSAARSAAHYALATPREVGVFLQTVYQLRAMRS